ncbi:hypothetical protein AMAG_01442 [Allomyces macrogynus ATCC 38327]|uniref:Uncharacterized protein n=1 Tax=Allomyces macrogynus (strain ATCC 38327) TaxID=578462 RepID=A0A0L0RYU1_ALLM3|nr:hypothetical protein AMAG_01442 [Allomyces macrogynus ATCC 38327]|eukprot:KNE55552.1 hypothetical protein AMAG_01442 [Allomyces macrogynus ATCC 38327]
MGAAAGTRGSVASVSSSLRTAMVGPPHTSLTRSPSRLGNLLRSLPMSRGNSAGPGEAPSAAGAVAPGVAELGGGSGSGVVGTPGSPRRAAPRAASPLRMSAVAWTLEREKGGSDAEPLVPAKEVENTRDASPVSSTGVSGSRSGDAVSNMRRSRSSPQDDADVSINSTQFDLPPANRIDKGGSVPESLVTVVQSAKDLDKSKLVITSTESVRTAPDVQDLSADEEDNTDHDVKGADQRR